MTFIDWFAGIGGFRKGMEDAGHKCVGFCEWDKYAVMSYTAMHLATPEQLDYLKKLSMRKRQEEITKEEYKNGEWYADDIRRVDARSMPQADCWGFGAPCQDFSNAYTKRQGLDGSRSSLVREVFRLLKEIREDDRPEWIIYENVKGMLSSNRGFDFLAILLEMDECGYDIEWELLNSKDFGIPQNRERVYTIGHLRRYGEQKVFPLAEFCEADSTDERYRVLCTNTIQGINKLSRGIYVIGGETDFLIAKVNGYHALSKSETLCQPEQDNVQIMDESISSKDFLMFKKLIGRQRKNTVDHLLSGERKIRKLTPRECFRLQGWTDGYIDRAMMVNSDSQLYKQAGNGVTVNVVEAIAKRIAVTKERIG